MMEQFKVGDWAMDESGKYPPFQVDEDDLSQLPVEHNYLLNNCELWQPKEGEWVIPKTKTKESFNVFKYSKEYRGFELEPFIGELPSFLEDTY